MRFIAAAAVAVGITGFALGGVVAASPGIMYHDGPAVMYHASPDVMYKG
jgi:hypothetical protein